MMDDKFITSVEITTQADPSVGIFPETFKIEFTTPLAWDDYGDLSNIREVLDDFVMSLYSDTIDWIRWDEETTKHIIALSEAKAKAIHEKVNELYY